MHDPHGWRGWVPPVGVQLGWLAGMIEGEGSITISRGGQDIRVFCASTDRDVIDRVADLMGVAHPTYFQQAKSHHKACYKVYCGGRRAQLLINAIYPYMGGRRQARMREVLSGFRIPMPRNKLSPQAVREIRSSDESRVVLAHRFSVTHQAIGNVQCRRSWTGLP